MLRAAVMLAGVAILAACAGSSPPMPGAGAGRCKVGKPYQIKGIWYYPAEDWDYDETGIASWYGPGFHGKVSANGEMYDENAMTAAHKTLPMPALVRVTNLENGRSVIVRVNDRGPYAPGRIIDMSRRGAQLLGFERKGVAKVRVQVLEDDSRRVFNAACNNAPAPRLPDVLEASAPAPAPAPVGPVVRRDEVVADNRFMPAPIVIDVPVPASEQIYVQVGAFGDPNNVENLRRKLRHIGPLSVSPVVRNGERLERVRLGPFDTVDRADAVLDRVIQAGLIDAKIVVD